MSCGRSTVALKKGKLLQTSAGDITAIHPLGNLLTDRFLIECKHIKDRHVHRFVTEHSGTLAGFWEKVCQQAIDHQKKPMLICKQNHYPILLLIGEELGDFVYTTAEPRCIAYVPSSVAEYRIEVHVYLFSEVLESRFRIIRGA